MNKTDKIKKAFFLKRHKMAVEEGKEKEAKYFWDRYIEIEDSTDDRFIMGRDNQ